jgi:hypothetical protein
VLACCLLSALQHQPHHAFWLCCACNHTATHVNWLGSISPLRSLSKSCRKSRNLQQGGVERSAQELPNSYGSRSWFQGYVYAQ